MEANDFKVIEWLRKIRDEHYESAKNKNLDEDRQEISSSAQEMYKKIDEIRTKKALTHQASIKP